MLRAVVLSVRIKHYIIFFKIMFRIKETLSGVLENQHIRVQFFVAFVEFELPSYWNSFILFYFILGRILFFAKVKQEIRYNLLAYRLFLFLPELCAAVLLCCVACRTREVSFGISTIWQAAPLCVIQIQDLWPSSDTLLLVHSPRLTCPYLYRCY
jgi:hypothetical protein